MLYYLFHYLREHYNMPGANVFNYISFRAAMAVIISLLISMVFGKRLIRILHKKQVGESIRDLGLTGQKEKEGTPTMGGLIILASILIPTLLFARLENVYVLLMIAVTIWLGIIGFLDDYIKVFKKDKKGLSGKFKVFGQVGIGLIVGFTLYFNSNVVVKEKLHSAPQTIIGGQAAGISALPQYAPKETKSLETTIPFIKNNEFDYSSLISFFRRWV